MKKVQVLLSSYNGEKYIREQIDSILSQRGVDVSLLVRDDGSTDSTCQILEEYSAENKLRWYQGENLKPARSFLQLLRDADTSEYFAFADQDDYWQPEKLEVAINSLERYTGQPAMYFCKTQLADSNLKPIASPVLTPRLTFGESLVYEFMPGCTMVLNKRLKEIINTYSPEYLSMHDVWIYGVAQAVGAKIIFDPVPHILYRQHGNNTIGQGQGKLHEWRLRLGRLFKGDKSRSRRAEEIEKGYCHMITDENKMVLNAFLNGKSSISDRIRLLHDRRFDCGSQRTYNFFKLAIILNTY